MGGLGNTHACHRMEGRAGAGRISSPLVAFSTQQRPHPPTCPDFFDDDLGFLTPPEALSAEEVAPVPLRLGVEREGVVPDGAPESTSCAASFAVGLEARFAAGRAEDLAAGLATAVLAAGLAATALVAAFFTVRAVDFTAATVFSAATAGLIGSALGLAGAVRRGARAAGALPPFTAVGAGFCSGSLRLGAAFRTPFV